MIKLKPISKDEYDSIVLERRLQELLEGVPAPTPGARGERGSSGARGAQGEPGITTTVTREVLANKEALLDKEEFEEFKKLMLNMEQDIRSSLSQTHGYFPGGGTGITDLSNVIEVDTDTTIEESQIRRDRINVVLVTVPDITLTLPAPDVTKILWVQQGYTGTGTFQVCRT